MCGAGSRMGGKCVEDVRPWCGKIRMRNGTRMNAKGDWTECELKIFGVIRVS